MRHLMNAMTREAQRAADTTARARIGVVTSFDPNSYAAKVAIQPSGDETGWMPVASEWVGSGWGLFCPPTPGDQVLVEYQEGDFEAGIITCRLYSDQQRPLPAPAGEFWLVHKSGSLLKFHNDGGVELVAAGTLTSSAPQWNHSGPVNITGNVVITGTERVTGQIVGQGGMAVSGGSGSTISGPMTHGGGSLTSNGITLHSHTHGGIKAGGDVSGGPQ